MPARESQDTTPAPAVQVGAWTVVAAVTLYGLLRAFTLRTQPWDAFVYLTAARRFLGEAHMAWVVDRPPLIPLAYAPGVAWATSGPLAGVQYLVIPQVQAWLLSVLCLALLAVFFRRSLPAGWVVPAVMLVCASRIWIRNSTLVMTDLPSAGAAVLAFVALERAQRLGTLRWWLAVSVTVGVSITLRYTLLALGPALVAAGFLLGLGTQRTRRDWALLVGGPLVGMLLGAALVALAVTWGRWGEAGAVMRELQEAHDRNITATRWTDAPWMPIVTAARFAALVFVHLPTPIVPLAVWGVVVAVGRRHRWDRVCLAWLGMLGASLCIIRRPEARYVFPLAPPLAYFCIEGTRDLAARGAAVSFRAATWLPHLLVAASMLMGVHQVWLDADPMFTADIPRKLALTANAQRHSTGRLLQVRLAAHNIFPQRRLQLGLEDWEDMYHLGRHTFMYFLGEAPVMFMEGRQPPAARLLAFAQHARDGDVFVDFDGPTLRADQTPDAPNPVDVLRISRAVLDVDLTTGLVQQQGTTVGHVEPRGDGWTWVPHQDLGRAHVVVASGAACADPIAAGWGWLVPGSSVPLPQLPSQAPRLIVLRVQKTSIHPDGTVADTGDWNVPALQ